MTYADDLAGLLDRLPAGGAATGGDWGLRYDSRVGRFVLTRADGMCALFTRDDLLDYARREPVLFKHRQWLVS